MTCEIREICSEWALDINFPFETVTIYFCNKENAVAVKNILDKESEEREW